MFNAKEFVAVMEPPRFIDLDGREHTGHIMSAPEHARSSAMLQELKAKGFSATESQTTMEQIAALMFDGDGVKELMRLPTVALQAAMLDFFASHRQAADKAAEMALPGPQLVEDEAPLQTDSALPGPTAAERVVGAGATAGT